MFINIHGYKHRGKQICTQVYRQTHAHASTHDVLGLYILDTLSLSLDEKRKYYENKNRFRIVDIQRKLEILIYVILYR